MTTNAKGMKPFDFDKALMMESVTNKNKVKLAWYCLIGRAIAVGYLVNPYLNDKQYAEKQHEAKGEV